MFLLLEEHSSAFGEAVGRAAVKRGLEIHRLSPRQLADDVGVVFRMDDAGEQLSISVGDRAFTLGDILGCFCGFDTFHRGLWERFSEKDTDYAARETHALWLAVLTALGARMVNPPAPDALGGSALPPGELFHMAQDCGLKIPMVLYLESGHRAGELQNQGGGMTVEDLGTMTNRERSARGMNSTADLSENAHRVVECVNGCHVWVAPLGDTLFVSGYDAVRHQPVPEAPSRLSEQLRESLRQLGRTLHLRTAEYAFCIDPAGQWVFQGLRRTPELATIVYGDAVAMAIVDSLLLSGSQPESGA